MLTTSSPVKLAAAPSGSINVHTYEEYGDADMLFYTNDFADTYGSGYFLKLFHEIQPKELPCEDFFEVLKVLRQISNNMNQIALRANVTGIVNAKEYWENSRRLQEAISVIKGMMN